MGEARGQGKGSVTPPPARHTAGMTRSGDAPDPNDASLDAERTRTRFTAWLGRAARAAGSAVASRALVLWYAARDPDTPARAKAVIYGALAYLVEPIDLIPDLTPLLGYTDDMSVLGIALTAVLMYVKPEHEAKAQARVDALFGRVGAVAETASEAEGEAEGEEAGDAVNPADTA